jgi:mitogen-activated protein kinase 1/3
VVELQDLFIVNNDLYIVMNMMNTDLKLDLEFGCRNGERGKYQPDKTRIILYGILNGLKYVHQNDLIHRDLKPGNVLLGMSDTGQVKVQLCDFGMSSTPHTSGQNVNTTPMDSRYVVTRMYRPPEIILESSRQTSAIDIFSVGCIFAEMLFAEQSPPQYKRLFGADSSCSRREIGGELRHLYLIASICGTPDWNDIDGSDNAKQVLFRQPWFQQKMPAKDLQRDLFPASCIESVELLRSMLHFNPAKRCTVEQALNSIYFKGFKDPFPSFEASAERLQEIQLIQQNIETDNRFNFANNIDKVSMHQVRQWFHKEVETLY